MGTDGGGFGLKFTSSYYNSQLGQQDASEESSLMYLVATITFALLAIAGAIFTSKRVLLDGADTVESLRFQLQNVNAVASHLETAIAQAREELRISETRHKELELQINSQTDSRDGLVSELVERNQALERAAEQAQRDAADHTSRMRAVEADKTASYASRIRQLEAENFALLEERNSLRDAQAALCRDLEHANASTQDKFARAYHLELQNTSLKEMVNLLSAQLVQQRASMQMQQLQDIQHIVSQAANTNAGSRAPSPVQQQTEITARRSPTLESLAFGELPDGPLSVQHSEALETLDRSHLHSKPNSQHRSISPAVIRQVQVTSLDARYKFDEFASPTSGASADISNSNSDSRHRRSPQSKSNQLVVAASRHDSARSPSLSQSPTQSLSPPQPLHQNTPYSSQYPNPNHTTGVIPATQQQGHRTHASSRTSSIPDGIAAIEPPLSSALLSSRTPEVAAPHMTSAERLRFAFQQQNPLARSQPQHSSPANLLGTESTPGTAVRTSSFLHPYRMAKNFSPEPQPQSQSQSQTQSHISPATVTVFKQSGHIGGNGGNKGAGGVGKQSSSSLSSLSANSSSNSPAAFRR